MALVNRIISKNKDNRYYVMKKRFIKYTLSLAVLALITLFATARAENSKIVYDQYFIYKVKDAQIGFGHTTQKTDVQNGKNVIITDSHVEQKLQRFGFVIKILLDSEFVEDESGNPVSFYSINQNQGDNSKIQGQFVSDNEVSVTSTANGISKTENVKLNKKILFPYAINQLFKNNPDRDKIEYSTIDTSLDFRVINFSAQKLDTESLNESCLNGNYNKYNVVMDLLPNINNTEWHDSEGRTVKEASSIFNIECLAVDKDKISGETKSFDILDKSLIPVNTSITDPSDIEQINYKIEITNGAHENLFVSDSRQRIIQATGRTTYLKIKNEQMPEEKYSYPVNTKGLEEYLKSGPFINSDDNAIKMQSIYLLGQEKDAYKIAKTMEKWVYDSVKTKDFSVNFANAKDVLKNKKGDCTEHSVLLASLLRSAGIPSKVVIGLMYTDRPETAFAYHMWVKAYIGKWINLDPSFPQTENFSPVHIALYETPLNNLSNRSDMIVNLVKSFANIKINILNFSQIQNDTDKKKVSPADNLPVDDRFKVSNFLPSQESPTNTDNIDGYLKQASVEYSNSNIKAAYDNYIKAINLISYNDDYLQVILATKLAEQGFLNLSNERLKNIYTPEIWNNKTSEIKQIYFPKKFITPEKELILAGALSKLNSSKDPDGAIAVINQNKDLSGYEYARYILAKAYIAKNDSKDAMEILQKITGQNPKNINYKFELAQLYISKNELKKAKNLMDFILKQNITDENLLNSINIQNYWLNFKLDRKVKLKSQYYLAKYYQAKGDTASAIGILNKLTDEKYKETVVYDFLGEIYLSLNQTDKAELNFKKSLALDNEDFQAIIGLGDIDFIQDKYNDSLQKYLKAEKISDDSVDLLCKIAENYKLLSREENAYTYFNRALVLDSMNFKANLGLGRMYFDMGDYNKAKQYLTKALTIKPFTEDIWLKLAMVEINNKNYFLAKTYLIPVSHIDSKSSDYYYYLELINKNNQNFNEAKENVKWQ